MTKARVDARSFTIRPWLIATVGGVSLAFAVVYLSATGYLVFRDDLLAASIAPAERAAAKPLTRVVPNRATAYAGSEASGTRQSLILPDDAARV